MISKVLSERVAVETGIIQAVYAGFPMPHVCSSRLPPSELPPLSPDDILSVRLSDTSYHCSFPDNILIEWRYPHQRTLPFLFRMDDGVDNFAGFQFCLKYLVMKFYFFPFSQIFVCQDEDVPVSPPLQLLWIGSRKKSFGLRDIPRSPRFLYLITVCPDSFFLPPQHFLWRYAVRLFSPVPLGQIPANR